MAGLMSELLEVLNEECGNYKNLLDLSHEKNHVLVKNDIKSLQKITNLENMIVGNNQKLEKKRGRIVEDMALVLGRGDLSLSVLADLTKGQKEHPDLLDVTNRLRDTVEQLKLSNETNRTLITLSLDYIEFNLNLLRDNNDLANIQSDSMFQAQQ